MRRDVTFYGYFLTKFKYRAKDQDKVTPLLIGPTVIVEGKNATQDDGETPFAVVILGVVLGGLIAMTLLFLVVNFWWRRGDERIRSTLDVIQAKNNPPAFVNEEPPPPNPDDA